jgi:hypothetical protein
MSTTKTSTSTNTYNQGSMNAFNALQPQVQNLLQQYMNNPNAVVSPFYDLATQAAQRQANVLGANMNANVTGNLAASGFGGTNLPAFLSSQIAANNRAASGMRSNAFLQGQLGKAGAALGVQQMGLSGASAYRPLQTGGKTTETQGGLGSWLPQLAGAGLGLAGMAFGGGAGAFPAASSMGQNAFGNFVSPGFTPQNAAAPSVGMPSNVGNSFSYFNPLFGGGPGPVPQP